MDETLDFYPEDAAPTDTTYDTSSNDWFWNAVGEDPTSSSYWDTLNSTDSDVLQQVSNQDPSVVSAISDALSKLGSGAVNFLKSKFTKDGEVNWKNVAAAAGGLYGLYQSQNQDQPKTGYQGGIPRYSLVREAVPEAMTDTTRRAGSGGQRYFSSSQYVPAEGVEAAKAAAKEEAAGLQALNRSNLAREEKRSPTSAAAERGQESEQVREGVAPSKVIESLPVPKYATGGITALAKGRYLGGATDGMADKIPAQIDGKQEAKLSHGEFVIPADVVSHLGNGNSDAGAQRLYDMMDRIRKARTGTAKQGKQINPNKFMPT